MQGLTEERNRDLNTPKAAKIDELFEKALGIAEYLRPLVVEENECCSRQKRPERFR